MLEMSSTGAKVLHTRSVELAMKNNLTLQVLSSMINKEGTFIIDEKKLIEKEIVSGVSYSKNESKISISGIPDKPGLSAEIFGLLADKNINVDMIVQKIYLRTVLQLILHLLCQAMKKLDLKIF